MEDIKKYWWRKVSDVNREYASFEMMSDDDLVADLGFSDAGILELYFYDKISEKTFDWLELSKLIEKGVEMANRDKE